MVYIIIAAVAVLIAVLLARGAAFKPVDDAMEYAPLPEVDPREVAEHLSGALKFRTVSYNDESLMDFNEFRRFHDYLEKTYPLVHSTLTREVVGRASLLYKWSGSDPSLAPMALMAHQDVVAPGELSDWKHPPFDGVIDGEYVWGRGANDIKCMVIAELEAVERLIARGFVPKRDVYLCFGHNEEVNGEGGKGAEQIAALLDSRGVRLDSVLDEGGAVIEGTAYGIKPKVAAIGVAEKGYADIEIAVSDKGGHSSTPGQNSGLVRLSRLIQRFDKEQFKARLIGPVLAMFGNVGRHMSFGTRVVLANKWLLSSVLKSVLLAKPQTAAMLRTTTAVTMAAGSAQPNVLPEKSTATINFRILPGENGDDIIRHVERICGSEAKIVSTYISEPSPLSPTDTRAFRRLCELTHRIGCGAVPTEYLVMGGTDSRFFYRICDNVYRFVPIYQSNEVLATAHSVNERIAIEGLGTGAAFLMEYIGGYDG